MASKTKPQPYERSNSYRRVVKGVQNLANSLAQMNETYLNLLDRYKALGKEKESLLNLMQEAIDDCETCRGETGGGRCARCQTFAAAIAKAEGRA